MLDFVDELIIVNPVWKFEKYALSLCLPEVELHKLQTILCLACLNQIDTF